MLNENGAFDLVKWRHVLTPIAIDWESDHYLELYKSLYVFGIRLARWRAVQPQL